MNAPFESALELVGNTPMVKLSRISSEIPAEIWAKLEFYNPSGSVKDRIALKMVEEAEKRGELKKGSTIIEPTSGNTGIALALVSAIKGYQFIAVIPEAVSKERRMMIELMGAKVELVSCCDKGKGITKEDMENVVERAKELSREIPDSFMPNQFDNEDNPSAHAETTAEEILAQTKGKLSVFVAACGTGGTFTGVARVFKEKAPNVRMVAVEPSGSAVLSGKEPGFHKIEGIGEGFIPNVLCVDLADEIVTVSCDDAFNTCGRLWREEGIMGGISSGANVHAALEIGRKMKEGETIVTLIPDTGMRYFSTQLFGCNSSEP
jgi:cysteine synthase A